MLKGHKNKIDPETKSICEQCKVEETPSHYLLHCKLFEEPRRWMMKNVTNIFNTNSITFKNTLAELLGEHNLKNDDSKKVRREVIDFINTTKKEI